MRTGRWTNIRMSTSGSRTLRSTSTHTAVMTAAPAKEPRVRLEAQPHSWPWEIASRSSSRAMPRVSAPRKSVRPPVLCRVAGTSTTTASRARAAKPVAIQKALR